MVMVPSCGGGQVLRAATHLRQMRDRARTGHADTAGNDDDADTTHLPPGGGHELRRGGVHPFGLLGMGGDKAASIAESTLAVVVLLGFMFAWVLPLRGRLIALVAPTIAL